MYVKMLDSFAGPGVELIYGRIYDLDTDEATRMISRGGAVLADSEEIELREIIDKAKKRLEEKEEGEKMTGDAPNRNTCKGKTKAGNSCQRKPLIDGDYCSAHKK